MSTYRGCGCNSEDCRVNGCLMKRQAQSAIAPGGGGMPAEPVKSSLKVSYDSHGDCLYVVCDSNEPAHAEEDDKGILYRRAISDGRLVGITIMNFMGRRGESSGEAPQPAEPEGKTDWNAELASWSDEDFIRIFYERPDLANRLRKILAEPVKRKRLYAPGSALGEFGVIPMCDQYLEDEPVKVPPGYALIAEKYLEEMIGPELMDQLAKREL